MLKDTMNKGKDNTIKTVGNCCTGCNACVIVCHSQAIRMEENQKGFRYPYIDIEKCINCGGCRKVCPALSDNFGCTFKKCVYAVKIKDLKKRMESQSGGAFTAFAEQILKEGGIVYGVEFTDEKDAVYVRCDNLFKLKKLKKSKYIEAKMNDVYNFVKNDLMAGRIVLMCGTPCAVTALKNYMEYMHIDTENLVLCDLICHGVPSTKVFREYLNLEEKRYGKILKHFDFRDKIRGNWWGNVCSFKVGTKRIISENYVKIFYSHLCLRESCYTCRFTTLDRTADITIGDYWGIEKVIDGFADRDGVSVCIIHSLKGNNWFKKVKDNLEYLETNVEDCLQPNLIRPTGKPSDYDMFWDMYMAKGLEEAASQYCGYDHNADYVYRVSRLEGKWGKKKEN